MACGTGRHLEYFRQYYEAEGLDLDAGLLEIAAERNPESPLHQADMVDYSLDKDFDVVTCLFSSIGYVASVERMRQAISNMARHLRPRGVLILEPWFGPEEWEDGHVSSLYVDQPQLKAARMNVARSKGRLSVLASVTSSQTPPASLTSPRSTLCSSLPAMSTARHFRGRDLKFISMNKALRGEDCTSVVGLDSPARGLLIPGGVMS